MMKQVYSPELHEDRYDETGVLTSTAAGQVMRGGQYGRSARCPVSGSGQGCCHPPPLSSPCSAAHAPCESATDR